MDSPDQRGLREAVPGDEEDAGKKTAAEEEEDAMARSPQSLFFTVE